MKRRKKPSSWHCCEPCGDQFFPDADKKYWAAITVMQGDCPDCGEKNVTLIPIEDFQKSIDFD